jgi:LL-diaminopimelate aminotransferase
MNFRPAILYIDDEAFNLDSFQRAFGSEYHVKTCLSGAEALQVLEKEDFPLVIADERMPGMTGIELCEKLYEIRPQMIRMLLTAYSEPELILKAINRGHVQNYIIKPWKKSEIKPVVEKALEDYKQRMAPAILFSDYMTRLPDANPIARIFAARKEIQKKGIDVVDVSLGEPNLSPPACLLDSLAKASRQQGQNYYPPLSGTSEFREAIAKFYERRYGVHVDSEKQIYPLIGSKEGLVLLSLCFSDPNKPIYVRRVDYPVYRSAARLSGAPIVELEGDWEDRYIPRFPAKENRQGGIVFLSSPSNPTSAVLPAVALKKFIEACQQRSVVVAFDAAYLEIGGSEKVPHPLGLQPDIKGVIEFHSFSKALRVPSWRAGFVVGSPEIVQALGKMKSFVDTGVPLPIQWALTESLEAAHESIEEGRMFFVKQQALLREALAGLPIEIFPSDASLFCWIRTPGIRGADLAAAALEEGLLFMPGNIYGPGGEYCIRLSVALSPERFPDVRERLEKALRRCQS